MLEEEQNEEHQSRIIRVEIDEEIRVADHAASFVVPFDAFRHNVKLAEKLANSFPEMSLVMIVSALETYFKQELRDFNDFTKYLVKNKKLRFQSYEEMKEIFKKGVGVSLPELDPNAWEVIAEYVPKRHRIVHHAGLDEKNQKIVISPEEAKRVIESVKSIACKAKERIEKKKDDHKVASPN